MIKAYTDNTVLTLILIYWVPIDEDDSPETGLVESSNIYKESNKEHAI